MKLKTIIIIIAILGVVIAGLISGIIITGQAGRLRNIKLENELNNYDAELTKWKIKVKMRDDILKDIKQHANFKNISKVKQDIEAWEQLKETEKEKVR